jgi:hypothetical protein
MLVLLTGRLNNISNKFFMKKSLHISSFLLLLLIGGSKFGAAQSVAINNDGSVANLSAILDIKSVNKGLLIPRMSSAQRTAISSPAEGLKVFDTDTKSFWYYNGTGWLQVATGSPTNFWSQSGSSIFNTNPGNIGIGTSNPLSVLALQTPLNTVGFTHTGGSIGNQIVVSEAIGGISASFGTGTNHPFRIMSNEIGRLHVYPTGEIVVGDNTTGSFGRFTVETTNNSYGISHISQEGNIIATRIGGTSAGIGTFSNTNMRLFCNGANALIIDAANGNIGVGTDAPGARLHVAGSQKIDGFGTLEFGAGFTKEANAGKIGYASFTPGALDILGAGTDLTDRKIKFWSEGGSEFTGRIGIGTAPAPEPGLHIVRNGEAIRLAGASPYMTFFNGNDYKGYVWNKGADDMEFGTASVNANGKLLLSIKGTPALTIHSNSKVSINGDPGAYGSPTLTLNASNGFNGGLCLNGEATWRISTSLPGNIIFWKENGHKASIDEDGDYISVSDASLKEDIIAYKPVLRDIKNLQVSTYHYKSNAKGTRSFGLIAQNVARYFPEVVAEMGGKEGQRIMGIVYGKISVLAVKAIQEQQEIIEKQHARIESLEKRLASIEQMMAQQFK